MLNALPLFTNVFLKTIYIHVLYRLNLDLFKHVRGASVLVRLGVMTSLYNPVVRRGMQPITTALSWVKHCCPLNPWWRHPMKTFSALLALCAGNSPVPGEFPAQRPVTRSFDVFFICVWINGCVNNREAGGLRHYRAHYDVTLMPRLKMMHLKSSSYSK